ncbi:MAG: ilvI, partial [Modestobacter sp.]|nr:ilvI [Modestobacter sp.]
MSTTSSAGRTAPGATAAPGAGPAPATPTVPTEAAAQATLGVETTARSMAEAAAEPVAGITGAQSLVRSLEAVGVEVVFGIPGGAILPAYDPLFDSALRHVLVRHEQGAGHAATGYAQATG